MTFFYVVLAVAAVAVGVLLALRVWDWHCDRQQWSRLAATQPASPAGFAPTMVAGLPEPARRFFCFAITPGTPLLTVAKIDMGGEFSLGSREHPNYQPMAARQILAAPTGFVWQLRLPNWVSGSDFGSGQRSWTRFRILGLVPVARLGGNPDHARAAFGRYIAEAVFWTPAALLPGPKVVWEGVDRDTARVTVSESGLSQSVDVQVAADGRPVTVRFLRWSNANPERRYQLQPFGGHLSDFREVQGFRLPFNVEAGNMFGTDAYFAFFKARVRAIRFDH